jgi:hypothetical protein
MTVWVKVLVDISADAVARGACVVGLKLAGACHRRTGLTSRFRSRSLAADTPAGSAAPV